MSGLFNTEMLEGDLPAGSYDIVITDVKEYFTRPGKDEEGNTVELPRLRMLTTVAGRPGTFVTVFKPKDAAADSIASYVTKCSCLMKALGMPDNRYVTLETATQEMIRVMRKMLETGERLAFRGSAFTNTQELPDGEDGQPRSITYLNVRRIYLD